MWTPIVFIVLLSLLVLIHELGHFLAAKKIGVKVEEFGLGYPPRIFGKKIGDTIYSLNLLPFGGFVKLFGENGEVETNNLKLNTKNKSIKSSVLSVKSSRAFYNRTKLERATILIAGVFMNFVLGVLVITIIFTNGVLVPSDKIYVQSVAASSPAALAGIVANDQIVSIDGIKLKTPQDLIEKTRAKAGNSVTVVVKRCVLEKTNQMPTGKENDCSIIEKKTHAQSRHFPKRRGNGSSDFQFNCQKIFPLGSALFRNN